MRCVRWVWLLALLCGCDKLFDIHVVSSVSEAGIVGDAAKPCLEDDFATIDVSTWLPFDAPPQTIASIGGELVVTLGPNGPDTYAGLGGARADFRGGSVQVEVTQVPSANGGSGGAEGAMQWQQDNDPDNAASISVDGGRLVFRITNDGQMQDSSVPYSAVDHRFWRLVHDPIAASIRYETSRNGALWAMQREVTPVWSVASATIHLFAGTYISVPSPGRFKLDNLRATGCTFL